MWPRGENRTGPTKCMMAVHYATLTARAGSVECLLALRRHSTAAAAGVGKSEAQSNPFRVRIPNPSTVQKNGDTFPIGTTV